MLRSVRPSISITLHTLAGSPSSQPRLGALAKSNRAIRVQMVMFTLLPSSESGNASSDMLWDTPDLKLNLPVAKMGVGIAKERSKRPEPVRLPPAQRCMSQQISPSPHAQPLQRSWSRLTGNGIDCPPCRQSINAAVAPEYHPDWMAARWHCSRSPLGKPIMIEAEMMRYRRLRQHRRTIAGGC